MRTTILAIFRIHSALEKPWGKMAKGVHGNNLLLVRPLWEGANIRRRLSIREIRSAVCYNSTSRNREFCLQEVNVRHPWSAIFVVLEIKTYK
jgi:hypothetical protein